MKKLLLIALVLSLMVPLMAREGHAQTWYTCNVLQTGPSTDGSVWVLITEVNGAFGPAWYSLATATANQQLATALTAIASTLRVRAHVSTTPNTTCDGMVLTNTQ